MNILGIIPARMASTRFPNKPMAKIASLPMIDHVYHRSKMCSKLNDVWVATCDRIIVEHIESIGGNAIMTADTHERASDRAAEAVTSIEKETKQKIDFVALIQGDEPMLMPSMLDELIAPVEEDKSLSVVNLISEIHDSEELKSPNTVKVVFDLKRNAMYFSREPIPSEKKYGGKIVSWKQLGIILFSRDALLRYASLTPSPLEVIESVDMNRFLEHGIDIRLVPTEIRTQGVDTPEDLSQVDALFGKDELVHKYR